MIEKMSYVNITGPQEEYDRITENYLGDYEIHLENAVQRLEGQDFVAPFIETDPYSDLLSKAEELEALLPKPSDKSQERALKKYLDSHELSKEEAVSIVSSSYEELADDHKRRDELLNTQAGLRSDLENIRPFTGLNYSLREVLDFKYVAYRFGRIPRSAYDHFIKNSEADISSIFHECNRDENYVWGVFFVPENQDSRADSLYASLHFERFKITGKYSGTPAQICDNIEQMIQDAENEINALDERMHEILYVEANEIHLAVRRLAELSHNFRSRRFAAIIEDDEDFDGVDTPFFLLCGWMRTEDAKELSEKLDKNEKNIICILNDNAEDSGLTPPTSIKNKGIFKPYELYTKMYGLPAYNEFDPTAIIALLYSFIFGAMFGDLGHGLCLLAGGAAIYLARRSQMAGVISLAGFFSCIFGLLYGSFFGFEDIIPTLWLKPREAMSTLNFAGRLNTIFPIAVLFGMLLMIALMIINILSHIKQKNFAGSIFTSNGIAGILFYGTVALIAVLYVTGRSLPATVIIIALIVISLVMMALNEPLTNLIKKRKALEGSAGMYAVETFFDLFETMLSYFSNTLSFVRVGAFAVSHAAMMEVVLSLGGYTNGGSGNFIVLVLGNIFVMGFEGLIVGIQVLRLQYYEIFSKFYKGDGREFKPYFQKRRHS